MKFSAGTGGSCRSGSRGGQRRLRPCRVCIDAWQWQRTVSIIPGYVLGMSVSPVHDAQSPKAHAGQISYPMGGPAITRWPAAR